MSKPKNSRQYSSDMVNARLKNIRISPQKLNLVAGIIRKKSISSAIQNLATCQKRIANDVHKLLLSAVSNAENNHNLNVDDLVVLEAFVGKGPVMKRFMARARGRGSRIEKAFSQIDIIIGLDKGKF